MIKNLADYFEEQQEFYLDKISYNRIEIGVQAPKHMLNCIDRIEANVNEDIVKLTVSRTIKFDPEEIFKLTVIYGAILKFKKEKKEDYKWREIDLAKEFKENGGFVLENLISRTSLLIAEITSSFGQPPVILPPVVVTPKEN
jgi:hypothetical protein|nr:MAG TPA: Protein-export protein secB, Greek key beta sheet.35A [Caudoviricetes sp.]